jgi:glycosyltransferase involved in cell wall biosynthesis
MVAMKFIEDKQIRVLMIVPSYDPIVGGTETAVKNLVNELNKNNVKVDVMTFNMDSKWNTKWQWEINQFKLFKLYRVPAVNIFTVNLFDKTINITNLFFRVSVIPNLNFRKLLKEYDILHFHDDVDLTFPLFSFFFKKPKVFQFHTLQETFNYYKKNLICKYILKRCADIFLCASEDSNMLLNKLKIGNVKILPNGVDITKFNSKLQVDNHNNLNINKDNLILFVGRFERRKGIHVLLESLDLLKDSVTLVIIGPNKDDEYAKEVFLSINKQKNGGKHKILYLGALEPDEIIKWLHRSLIFVCPSLSEPFGIVNIEAMACGIPVIASDTGGIKDIIDNRKDGILVPTNNPEKLAEAIQYLLENEDIRVKLGINGKKKVEKEFSLDYVTKQLIKIYDELLSN